MQPFDRCQIDLARNEKRFFARSVYFTYVGVGLFVEVTVVFAGEINCLLSFFVHFQPTFFVTFEFCIQRKYKF